MTHTKRMFRTMPINMLHLIPLSYASLRYASALSLRWICWSLSLPSSTAFNKTYIQLNLLFSRCVSVQYSIVLGFPVIQFSPFMSLYCTQLYLLAFNWTLSRCLCTPVASTRIPFNSVFSRSLSCSTALIRHLITPFSSRSTFLMCSAVLHFRNMAAFLGQFLPYSLPLWSYWNPLHVILPLSSSTFTFWFYTLGHLVF